MILGNKVAWTQAGLEYTKVNRIRFIIQDFHSSAQEIERLQVHE